MNEYKERTASAVLSLFLSSIASLQISFEIGCVKQLMGLFTARFSQEVLIEFLNGFVFMRHSHFMLCIDGIDSRGSLFQNLQVSMMIRLSASAYTATRTGHDFDGMVIAFPLSDAFQERSGVS